MTRYLLGDLVRNCKEKVDRDNNPYEYFVAGDHMETERPRLTMRGRFDEADVGPAFIRLFRPGQVLYGSRRTYLKKVSVADFEGVTSNVTFVLETKDEEVLPQRLLPFLLLSDRFTSYSIGKSKGSTNPYVLFSDLADFEVDLPVPVRVAEIADVMCAAEQVKENYRSLLAACDDVVKSQFVEIFSKKEFPLIPLSQACTKITDGTHKTPQYQETGIAFISAKNVTSDGKLDFSDIKHISTDEYESIQKRCETQIGDVLLTKSGSLGMPAIVDVDFPIGLFESLAVLKYRRDILDGVFLREQLKSARVQDQFTGGVKGIAVKHLHLNVIGRTSIIVPPLELQEEFTDFVLQVDKSKFAVQKALDELNATTKKILNQELGLGDV